MLNYFIDNNNIHFIHDAQLDITGYGNSIAEAKNPFLVIIEDLHKSNNRKLNLEDYNRYIEELSRFNKASS